MDKASVLAALRPRLEQELAVAVEAQRRTQSGATHEESKPEDDKDTRARVGAMEIQIGSRGSELPQVHIAPNGRSASCHPGVTPEPRGLLCALLEVAARRLRSASSRGDARSRPPPLTSASIPHVQATELAAMGDLLDQLPEAVALVHEDLSWRGQRRVDPLSKPEGGRRSAGSPMASPVEKGMAPRFSGTSTPVEIGQRRRRVEQWLPHAAWYLVSITAHAKAEH